MEAGDWTTDGWIINSGLKAGERVITDGVMKIGPGAPVQIVPPPAGAARSPAAAPAMPAMPADKDKKKSAPTI